MKKFFRAIVLLLYILSVSAFIWLAVFWFWNMRFTFSEIWFFLFRKAFLYQWIVLAPAFLFTILAFAFLNRKAKIFGLIVGIIFSIFSIIAVVIYLPKIPNFSEKVKTSGTQTPMEVMQNYLQVSLPEKTDIPVDEVLCNQMKDAIFFENKLKELTGVEKFPRLTLFREIQALKKEQSFIVRDALREIPSGEQKEYDSLEKIIEKFSDKQKQKYDELQTQIDDGYKKLKNMKTNISQQQEYENLVKEYGYNTISEYENAFSNFERNLLILTRKYDGKFICELNGNLMDYHYFETTRFLVGKIYTDALYGNEKNIDFTIKVAAAYLAKRNIDFYDIYGYNGGFPLVYDMIYLAQHAMFISISDIFPLVSLGDETKKVAEQLYEKRNFFDDVVRAIKMEYQYNWNFLKVLFGEEPDNQKWKALYERRSSGLDEDMQSVIKWVFNTKNYTEIVAYWYAGGLSRYLNDGLVEISEDDEFAYYRFTAHRNMFVAILYSAITWYFERSIMENILTKQFLNDLKKL